MRRGDEEPFDPWPGLICCSVAAFFLLGFAVLAVRLREVQVCDSAVYGYENVRQSVRRVQTDGPRGRILDRNGVALAENRMTLSIVCLPECFRKKGTDTTVAAISNAIADVGRAIGRKAAKGVREIRRHVDRSLALPLVVWTDADAREASVVSERSDEFPGFDIRETSERVYPRGRLAAHLLGYVGRDRGESVAGDEKFNFFATEMRGRSGLEIYYDSYLRGVSGERKVLVDARGFAIREWTAVEARRGPDLRLTLDARLQAAAERELDGLRGACVAIDPRNGDVLAMASAPGFNPNDFVPILTSRMYERHSKDPAKPLLNRASAGAYAPGSTFKPIVALAGLSAGWDPLEPFDCCGVYEYGSFLLHCASRWGHGSIDMRHGLMRSCNPYFCNLAMNIGTNAIVRTARAFGLGAKTGIDLGDDMAGVVPDAQWKRRQYRERWYSGDLAQMAIGQGMLLVSPLQMARVAGAIATGSLVTPRLNADLPVDRRPLPIPGRDLAIVREGMRMVVAGDGENRGTGWRGGEGVPVAVCGKTGTTEVGRGANRRKNVWFIAYAPAEAPTLALSLVIENGETGGGTAAPKAANVLKAAFSNLQPLTSNH